ncbi:hypothetical protein HCN44_004644 [Aphidius gifuensis]|uniref:Double-strand break repair protein n=1 Tax=Aphidius gifuensis TaxID=684658 RepID=A0A834XZH6_APHGI|nr:double-strand break repair protein MRE11-like [Aphidius gifuensis]KAF7995172.1 hypothetical protein HCN44_004644 [Aphidius gifuensis]
MGDEGETSTRPKICMKILIATDCHLGYEIKTKRAQDNDSFITFEEILELAVKHDVDFVLLGGDLFHDAKPSQKVILECVRLLKKYCLGNREVRLNFGTDPELVFAHCEKKMINYEDHDMNISMPVMTIHGNHDNPSFESTGTLDILQASGLINYFGKWNNLKQINITPLLFEKDGVNIAIYGLGYLGEQRLTRLIKAGQVNFQRPQNGQSYFNILVIHQNRARHSENNYVCDDSFPSWFHFILWGHEHQCLIQPEKITLPDDESYYICQPGSSVATSLCEGEAVQKHVGLLKINSEQQFSLKKLRLKTVRPFYMATLTVSELIQKGYCEGVTEEAVLKYVDDYIENTAIPEAEKQLTGHPQQPTLPLIRLKINTSETWHTFDTMMITNKYRERVANPNDIILFRKEKKYTSVKNESERQNDLGDLLDDEGDDQDHRMNVQGTIKRLFGAQKYAMNILSLAGLNEALGRCVDTNDDNAFNDIVQHQVSKQVEHLMTIDDVFTNDDTKKVVLKHQRQKTENNEEEELREANNYLNNKDQREILRKIVVEAPVNQDDDDDDDVEMIVTTKTRGRGRGARGTSKPRGTSRGRGRASAAKNALNITTTASTPSKSPPPSTTRAKPATKVSLFGNTTTSQSQSLFKTASQAKNRNITYVDSSDDD